MSQARVRLLPGITVLLFIGACALAGTFASAAQGAEVMQLFPVSAEGQDPAIDVAASGWKIRYEIIQPSNCVSLHNYGCGAVWEFQSIEFMRGQKAGGGPDWITILNKLALSEILVVYNDRQTFFDVSGQSAVFATPTRADIAGTRTLVKDVRNDGVVVELIDDHVRWARSRSNIMRRGQALDMWGILRVGNYSYILRYTFTDDGTIRVRAGATGRNNRDGAVGTDSAIHVHAPTWRFEFDLGSARSNTAHLMERQSVDRPGVAGSDNDVRNEEFIETSHRELTVEGGEGWNSQGFTNLMIVNSQLTDGHSPPHNIGYKVVPIRQGSLRSARRGETQKDFWLTRVAPSGALRGSSGPLGREVRYVDLMKYLRAPETITGEAVAIWHSSPLQHIPRTEDFGRAEYRADDGLALTMWSGFDLMPHNLWGKTPFIDGR